MKTTFDMMLEKTEQLLGESPLLAQSKLEWDIQRISAFKRGCRIDANCLYTADSRQLSATPRALWPKQLFCIAGEKPLELGDFDGNIALFPEFISGKKLTEAASGAGAFFGEWSAKLLDMVYEGRSLDEIVSFAHEYFQNPILIYDSSLKVLSYTSDEEVEEDMWNRTVTNRTVTEMDAAEAKELRKYISLAEKNSRPFRHTAPSLARPFYSCNILVKSKRAGMVDIMEKNRSLTKADLDMMENFCYLLSFQMLQYSAMRENLGSIYYLLLSELLNGGISTKDTLTSRLAAVNWDIAENFRVLSFVPVNSYMTDSEFKSIFESMMNMNIGGKGIIYEGAIVFILSSHDPGVLSAEKLRNLDAFCGQNGLRCGVSEAYTDILKTHLMYPRTRLALNYSSDNIVFFEDVRFTNILNYCSRYPRPEELLHPCIRELAEQDAEKQTEYLETLRVYLNCKFNQLAASKALYIHRTTMAYRLEKISELGNIDFNDSGLLLQLYFSLMLYDYLQVK